jgi:hypothetical protein
MAIEFVGGATIFVKVLPITDSKGKRLKARMGNGKCRQPSITIPWDYETEYKENFAVAARLFAKKLKWEGDMVGSWMGDDALFIFTN